MRKIATYGFLFAFLGTIVYIIFHFSQKEELSFFQAKDKRIHYVGRFDFSDDQEPKAWAPGVYLEFVAQGTSCELVVEDEVKFGNTHNYLEIVVDHRITKRIKLSSKINRIQLFKGLKAGRHHVLVCKNTESAIGFIKIKGIYCQELCKWKKPRKRLFEFIGDSITCGNGADSSSCSFGKGSWYDYHNAYLSYGARLSRSLKADWILSSVSGIGMNKSCCGVKHSMLHIYERIDFQKGNNRWGFSMKPDVVFITLGQNDGGNETRAFEEKYRIFLQKLRRNYPKSWFVCCTSPMAGKELKQKLKKSIEKVISAHRQTGDQRIASFEYEGIYNGGYDKHPTVEQHQMMMHELNKFVRTQAILSQLR
jgi:lysophospholipase L1-like esterase